MVQQQAKSGRAGTRTAAQKPALRHRAMRVLVTGIDGFVGSHAAEFLLRTRRRRGARHDPSRRGTAKHIEHLRDRVHLHDADIVDEARIEQIFLDVRPDRVIHLAGQAFVPTSVSDPVGTFRVNVMGGVAVLDAARVLGERTGQAACGPGGQHRRSVRKGSPRCPSTKTPRSAR